MSSLARVDAVLELIDAQIPPESLDVVQEVSGLLRPQYELIVALSGLASVTQQEGKDFIDVHHNWWPRCEFTTGVQRQFRKVFVMPLNRGIHDTLHHELPPPAIPNRVTMLAYLSLMDKKEITKDRAQARAQRTSVE